MNTEQDFIVRRPMIRNAVIVAVCSIGLMPPAANASIPDAHAPSSRQIGAGSRNSIQTEGKVRSREQYALGVLSAAGITDFGDIRVVGRDTIVNAKMRGRVHKVVVTRWGVVEVL